MREPTIGFSHDESDFMPYSQASTKHLQNVLSGNVNLRHPDLDMDFRRTYAALLLKERGL